MIQVTDWMHTLGQSNNSGAITNSHGQVAKSYLFPVVFKIIVGYLNYKIHQYQSIKQPPREQMPQFWKVSPFNSTLG